MTHSPAPWTVEADRFEMHVLASDYVGGSNTIASVYARSNGPDAEQVQQANADLIAKAPELAALLQELTCECKRIPYVIGNTTLDIKEIVARADLLLSAVAKAELNP